MNLRLKICGMKYPDNIQEISKLNPDYLGFIFWEHSSRKYEEASIIQLPEHIKKVAVFVNEKIEIIEKTINQYKIDLVQLHGGETPEFCESIQKLNVKVIKAINIGENFDFSTIEKYVSFVDYFLFDTKGKLPGGNGISFDWKLLEKYPYSTPFFLSGGIGLTSIDAIKEFIKSNAAKNCHAIDVNSRLELKAGFKNYSKVRRFKKFLYQ